MAIDKIFDNASVDGIADNLFKSVSNSVSEVKAMQQRKAAENVQLVIQALKKIESDIQDKYDGVTTVIEKRVSSIKDGKDGRNGVDGKAGKDGRPGRDGATGPRGIDGLNGRNGVDGEDGVSVVDAHIDFDGSLIIGLSSGRAINVGEVVAPDLAEKIKVITNGGGTSQQVLDTLVSLQNQINAILTGITYQGTWNASTNTPTLTSSAGTTNGFYIVSVAGSTNLNGISNWGVGDWAIFNGTVWQRVEGGSSGNFVDLSVSGTTTLSGLTASTALALDASKNVVSVTNTGTGNNVLATSPTLVTPALGTPSSGVVTNLTGTASININGTVGATTPAAGTFTSLSDSGNLTFTGTGNRITGDFSSTPTSRVAFQTSTVNGNTNIEIIPNGTATTTALNLESDPALTNGTFFQLGLNGGTDARLTSAIRGTGTYLPMTFYTGGSERMRLDTSGNVGIGTSSGSARLNVNGGTSTSQIRWEVNNAAFTQEVSTNAAVNAYVYKSNDASYHVWKLSSSEAMRLDSSGNVGIGTSSPTALRSTNLEVYNASGASVVVGTASTSISTLRLARKDATDGWDINYNFPVASMLSFNKLGTNAGPVFNIDSSGNVGIGTTSPASSASKTFTVQNNGSGGTTSITTGDYSSGAIFMTPLIESFGARNDGNSTFGGRIGAAFRRTDGTAISSGMNLGYYGFGGQWGTDTSYQSAKLLYAASIVGVAEGSFTSATAMPTAITFCTGSTGGAFQVANTGYGTERMRIDSSGNVQIGNSAVATNTLRFFDVYNTDTGASAGAIIRLVTSNAAASGNTTVDLVKYKSGGFILNNNDTNAAVFTAFGVGASERMRIDSSGNVLVTNPAGLGYGTGSGGTVTQATSKSTAVTLNKPTGKITMNNASLVASGVVEFVFNNSLATNNDLILLTLGNQSGAYGSYNVWGGTFSGGGGFYINVKNISGGSLSDALVINFAIIKGAIA